MTSDQHRRHRRPAHRDALRLTVRGRRVLAALAALPARRRR